jgi:diguanylate cyclase (GGDEF)-like protein
LFHKALDKSLEEARNNKTLLAILFLDLDRFKIINDSMGHPVGDELLTTVALRLKSLVGNQYIVSRFGGDEFTILMDGIKNRSEAASLAERITKEIERPVFLNGAETFITTSIGICIYPEHGHDAIELIRNADAAMYYAKASGRNNYQFYYNALNEKATDNIKLESSLRYALDKNEFVLHYQPQIALGTKCITGFEALLRWQHPTLGLLTPDKFLDVAIETGLIIPIGRWVLSEACNNIARLNKSSKHAVRIAVNLSTHQIMFGDIAADIKAVLAETGINPERLELEITESSFMQHEEHTISALRKVEAMGVKFAIDDFGTGYASMEYLKIIPVDRLKIDRTFIKDLAHDMMDKAIVRSIITLAHSITIPVVAEGVETEEQMDILNSMLCNEAQGFYFSPAVTADAAEEMLALSLSPEE